MAALTMQHLIDQEYLDLLWHTIPIPIKAIARHYGIDIQMTAMASDIGAVLHRLPNRWYLYVNSKDPVTRQRFTIAHELAHHLWAIPQDAGRDAWEEREADRCAAVMLMPGWKVREMLAQNLSVAEMAQQFVVSISAMRFRLDELRREEVRSFGSKLAP